MRLLARLARNQPGQPPAAQRDKGPDGFDKAEGPGALQETIGGAERAKQGEGEDVPVAAPLEGIGHEHAGNGEQPKERQCVQVFLQGRTKKEAPSEDGAL